MTTKEIIEQLELCKGYPAARDEAIKMVRNYNDCINELCLKCGKYQNSHLGACNGCRWEH